MTSISLWKCQCGSTSTMDYGEIFDIGIPVCPECDIDMAYICEAPANVNWKLLRKQKDLLVLLMKDITTDRSDLLDGLICMIDDMQDQGEVVYGSKAVYGEES